MIGLEDMLKMIFGDDLPDGMLDGDNPVGKGRVVWWSENYKSFMDSLGVCFIPVVSVDVFGDPIMLFKELGEIYEAVTGRSAQGPLKLPSGFISLKKVLTRFLE